MGGWIDGLGYTHGINIGIMFGGVYCVLFTNRNLPKCYFAREASK